VPKADPDRYNEFGRYVWREKGDTSLNQLAARGGISAVQLGRWMRKVPFRNPPPELLQGLARGLGRPYDSVRIAAMKAAGQVPLARLTDPQQITADAMSGLDEFWQRMIADVVLRLREEISRRDEDMDS
jgi:transcriptional regulator with XRE-family HTH domain